MRTIKFENFFQYFQNLITEKAADLYEDELLTNELRFAFFNNSGDYLNAMQNIVYVDDQPEDTTVLVNILNGGGVQDSSISIDAYVQIVSFEVLALDSQREDIMTLFTDICANYKSTIDELDFSTIHITFDDFPKYSEKMDCMGYEKFTTSVSTNIIVLPDAKLSNKYNLKIDGEDIKFNQLVLSRTTEMQNDLQKNNDNKFFPNSSSLQININGLYYDNNFLNSLLDGCANNSDFGNKYNLSLTTGNNNSILSRQFYVKDIFFVFAYGTIVSWQATFYTSANL